MADGPLVAVIMGSKSDWETMRQADELLGALDDVRRQLGRRLVVLLRLHCQEIIRCTCPTSLPGPPARGREFRW